MVNKINKKQTRFAQKLVSEINIGIGEAEALALAKDKNLLIVLDDKEARALAKSWGLEYTGTVMVLYEAHLKNLMNFDTLVDDLNKLAKIMWISTAVITEVIKKARR